MPKLTKSKKEKMSASDKKAWKLALKMRKERIKAQTKSGVFDVKKTKK